MKKHILITRIILTAFTISLFLVFRPIRVCGFSMYPTLQDGNTLICNTLATPQTGDIVVVKPMVCTGNKYIIKRITDIQDNMVYLEGDNRENSYDSRNFGFISIDMILGVVY